MTPIRRHVITRVQEAWDQAMQSNDLTEVEAINAAAQWLAMVLMSSLSTERQTHEVLNQLTENNHLYINGSWAEIEQQKQQRTKEEQTRRSRPR